MHFCPSAPKHMVWWSEKFHIHSTHTSLTHFFHYLLPTETSLWLKLPQATPHQKIKHSLWIFFSLIIILMLWRGGTNFNFASTLSAPPGLNYTGKGRCKTWGFLQGRPITLLCISKKAIQSFPWIGHLIIKLQVKARNVLLAGRAWLPKHHFKAPATCYAMKGNI